MNSQPRVSIAIPTLNEADNIERAIDSVLNQDIDDIEIIVCDGGSTDGTREIVRSLNHDRTRLLTHSGGLMAQMNKMVDTARGEFLAVLDADSVMLSSRLDQQLSRMRASPDTAAVGTALRYRTPEGEVHHTIYPPIGGEIKWQAIRGMPVYHTTALFRTQAVRSVGGYRHRPLADYDLIVRLAAEWELENLNAVLTETLERPSRGGRNWTPVKKLRHNSEIGARAHLTMDWAVWEYPVAVAWRLGTTIWLMWEVIYQHVN